MNWKGYCGMSSVLWGPEYFNQKQTMFSMRSAVSAASLCNVAACTKKCSSVESVPRLHQKNRDKWLAITVINIWPWAPDWAWHKDWPTVSRNVTLTLTLVSSSPSLYSKWYTPNSWCLCRPFCWCHLYMCDRSQRMLCSQKAAARSQCYWEVWVLEHKN
jgi:hypothetical protein